MNSQQIDAFLSSFSTQKLVVETESSRLVQSAKSDLNPDFTRDLDKLIESYHQLEVEVNQYIPRLPSYHVKSLTSQLKSLSDGIESAKDVIIPKKKFSFGRRGKGASSGACSVSKVVKSELEDTPKDRPKDRPTNEEDSVRIRKRRKDHNLTLSRDESELKVIVIEDIVDCTINLPCNPSTVYVKMIKDSILNIGPVSTSVFISDAINSTINACAQQVRVHDSTGCVLRLKVTGGAILENCSKILVGRYNYLYPELDADLAKVDMVDETRNKWDQIVDFNWLAGDTKSPNWDFLKDD